MMVTS
jgi:hypothetical protein